MSTLRKKNMEHLLWEVSAGLEILDKKTEVKEVILAAGYQQDDLDYMAELCTKAKEYYASKESKTREKQSISQEIHALEKKLRRDFKAVFEPARKAFKKDATIVEHLGLKTRVYVRRAVFLEKAKDFFTKLNNESYLTVLRGYGVTSERIQGIAQLIDDIETKLVERQEVKGTKEESKAARDTMIEQLRVRWKTLLENCLVWFEKNPEKLEGIFNVTTTTSKTKKDEEEEDTSENGETGDSPDETETEEPDPEAEQETLEPAA